MYLKLKFVLLANHDQNNVFRSVLIQLKVAHLCKVGIELKQESIVPFGLARSIERQARSIEVHAERFSADLSNSALSVLKHFQDFLFVLSIKGKPQPHFSVTHNCGLCKSLVRSKGAFLYTNLGFSRRRFIYSLTINSVASIEA